MSVGTLTGVIYTLREISNHNNRTRQRGLGWKVTGSQEVQKQVQGSEVKGKGHNPAVDGHCHGNMMVRHCATRLVCIAVVGQPVSSTSRNHGDNNVFFVPLFSIKWQAAFPSHSSSISSNPSRSFFLCVFSLLFSVWSIWHFWRAAGTSWCFRPKKIKYGKKESWFNIRWKKMITKKRYLWTCSSHNHHEGATKTEEKIARDSNVNSRDSTEIKTPHMLVFFWLGQGWRGKREEWSLVKQNQLLSHWCLC